MPESQNCMRCGRSHASRLPVVRPLCPQCWLAWESRKHPERALPEMLAPQTRMDQLVEDWLRYTDLIDACLSGWRGGRQISLDRLAHEERRLYVLTLMDATVRMEGFRPYFERFHRRDHTLVSEGLDQLDALEQSALYLEAESRWCSGGGELSDLGERYAETEDLVEQLALAAWAAGLIVETPLSASR